MDYIQIYQYGIIKFKRKKYIIITFNFSHYQCPIGIKNTSSFKNQLTEIKMVEIPLT